MSDIVFSDITADLESFLERQPYSSVFILTDELTSQYCYPLLPKTLRQRARGIQVLQGDANKDYRNCERIWARLLEYNADRRSVLINLGGGMISDLGGFAASVFKRGIPFINVPTTLMGMVDAAIGGKTGINFHHLKNQIGTFAQPDLVFICPEFLDSLSGREMLSGYAEICKYGLIADGDLWKQLSHTRFEDIRDWTSLIKQCAAIKTTIVQTDPKEKAERKILNFGHTIGHALESYSLANDDFPLLHGEAIAIGMLCEAYLSLHKTGLSEAAFGQISYYLRHTFPMYDADTTIIGPLIEIMRSDKKNDRDEFRFVCLQDIGKAVYDVPCSEEEIEAALSHYICL